MQSINARTTRSAIKLAKLVCYLEDYKPELLALIETWLDPSTANLMIPNYEIVGLRRDREGWFPGSVNHGGIALYRRSGTVTVTHLGNSKVAERSWYSIYSSVGPILLGIWYRPPNALPIASESL